MEKIFSAKIQEIVTPPDTPGDNLCFTLCFDSNDALMEEYRGKLFAVLDISSKNADKDSLNSTASLILTTLKESYYGDLEGTPIQALEKAVQLAKEKANTVQNYALDLNLLASVLWGKVLYTAQFGGGVAYIVRNQTVLDAVKQSLGDTTISSGIVEKEDLLILATPNFGHIFSKETISGNIGKMSDSVFMATGGKMAVVMARFDTAEKWGKDNLINFSLPARLADKNVLLSKIFGNKSVVVPVEDLGARNKKKRLVLTAAAVLLFAVLGFSVFSVIKTSKTKEAKSPTVEATGKTILDTLQSRLNKAKESDTESNTKELRDIALAAIPEGVSGEEKDSFNKVLGDATSILEENKSITIIKDPKVIYEVKDTVLDSPTGLLMTGSNLVLWSKNAYFTGSDSGTFTKTDRESFSACAEDTTAYFINTTTITKMDSKDNSSKDFSLPTEVSADKIISSKVYFQNIYLLDSGTSLLKLTSGTNSYTSASWLKQDNTITDAVDLAIDGNVYVLQKSGVIKKFYIGEEQSDFAVKGLPYGFINPVSIYTSIDLNEIYVLDSGDNSITLLDKTGQYIKKIVFSGDSALGKASSLTVNDTDKKAFVLIGTKLLEVDL